MDFPRTVPFEACTAPRLVALDTIDGEDDLYRMSYGFDPDALRASIRYSGVLHPLVLQDVAGGRRVVGGDSVEDKGLVERRLWRG